MRLPQVDRWGWAVLLAAAAWALSGCSSLSPSAPKLVSQVPATWQPEDQLKWESVKIPGKVATEYSLVRVNNRNKLYSNVDWSTFKSLYADEAAAEEE